MTLLSGFIVNTLSSQCLKKFNISLSLCHLDKPETIEETSKKIIVTYLKHVETRQKSEIEEMTCICVQRMSLISHRVRGKPADIPGS